MSANGNQKWPLLLSRRRGTLRHAKSKTHDFDWFVILSQMMVVAIIVVLIVASESLPLQQMISAL